MHTYPGTPPRTPEPPTSTHTTETGAGHTPTTTGPEDMRHTHPTTRSHRGTPERPTAHTQASTCTHGRQAVSGPHTHAQPHRRDHHHQPSQHQPPRPPAATTTTTTATTARDDMSTNRSSTNHTQRSDQRKHQTSRHRNNREPKTEPQTPQGVTAPTPFPDRFASTALTACVGLEHESITFAHCWEAVNPWNHAEKSLLVCCSARVRNDLKSSLPWVLCLA